MASRRRSVTSFAVNSNDEESPLIADGQHKKFYVEESEFVNGPTHEFYESTSTTTSFRVPHQIPEPGNLNLLSQKYESLDYDTCPNTIFMENQRKKTYTKVVKYNLVRWVVMLIIGVLTALTAAVVDMVVEIISDYKYGYLKRCVDECVKGNCLLKPLSLFMTFNAIPAVIGSILVTYIAPVAAGSGIPAIKCYLNGVKVPEVVRIKTYFVKAFGVILSVVGGMACGKEGPMIHCGAVIAAGVSQGKSTTFEKDLKIFKQFRDDQEKRDFVSAGAAAGVAAAFGAPVGGVLFSLEEGASFWNQALTWRIFFCSVISAFTLSLILSAYHGHAFELSYSGLVNFGKMNDVNYSFQELPLYIIIGTIGGLMGALFNFINYKLTVFRMKYIYSKWKMVVETAIVSSITATVGFLMIYTSDDCQALGNDPIKFPLQFKCGDGEYSALGAIWFQTPESSVKSLFHDAPGTWSWISLGAFTLIYFLLAIWTYGLSISSGVFIPVLLVGAAWGRLIGILVFSIFPDEDWVNPGKCALLGAAAMLGGVVRMTLSLTVILIEATGNITLGLPLMITLMVAKWVGDFFTEGLYDLHIQLNSVPFLAWAPPPLSSNIYASEVMSNPVTSLKTVESVGRIVSLLTSQTHNGFPVVDVNESEDTEFVSSGRFRGLILRWQLIVLLQHKVFNETAEKGWPTKKLKLQDFRDAYPRYPPIQQVHVSEQEKAFTIDLRPFMNPSTYTVSHTASLPRMFRLFRALGLRHLVVVNDRNEVVGMVTRKDLARFRMSTHKGHMVLEELQVSHG